MIVTGIGCTDTVMDYLAYDGGMPAEVRVPSLMCYWDPHAKRRNLIDRQWDAIAKNISIEEARRLCPGHDDVMLNAGWAGIDDDLASAGVEVDSKKYESDKKKGSVESTGRVTLIEMQWREVVAGYLLEDLQTGMQRDVPLEVGRGLVERLPDRYAGIEQPRYVYWRAILGGTLLKKTKLETQKGFTREYMTGYRDETKGYWYGLVRPMKDPQRTANVMFSQSVAMMKSGTKNGWAIEKSAVADIRKFERDQAKGGANLLFNDGGLAKAQPLQPSPPPAHTHELLGMSLDQVQQSVGIPIEAVAMATGNGPGQTALLESERRKTGMNLLASFFASKRTHLQRQAKLALRYVAEFMDDGRLMRVVSEGQTKYVPLWLEDHQITSYDIIVDESPTSPDARERVGMLVKELLPMMATMGMAPDVMLEMVAYLPNMPAELIAKFRAKLDEAKEPTPEQQKQQELAARAQEAEVAKIEGQAAKESSSAELNLAKVQEMGGRLTLDASEQARETSLAIAAPGSIPVREVM
jgi:hypothetical protein